VTESGTQEAAVYAYDYSATTTIYMVDTPGFDDGQRSDAGVLTAIAAWLTESYANDLKLSGIIYLRRVTDNRLGGSALRNLMMFQQLCGHDALSNVILVTNMWEQISPEIGKARENEFVNRQDYWSFMVSQGSQVLRHHNTKESAKRLIDIYASRVSVISPKALQLQVDMIDNDLLLGQTGAGRAVGAGLTREMEQLQLRLQSTKEILQKAINDATAKALEKYQKDTADRMRNIERSAKVYKLVRSGCIKNNTRRWRILSKLLKPKMQRSVNHWPKLSRTWKISASGRRERGNKRSASGRVTCEFFRS
jgi:hypothetical protein